MFNIMQDHFLFSIYLSKICHSETRFRIRSISKFSKSLISFIYLIMSVVFSKVALYNRKYPLIKGMLSYAALWPISSLIQQKIIGKEKLDYVQAARFCIYGSLFVAPTLYLWIRTTSLLWPGNSLKTALTKALVEQVTYGPAAMTCFFFGMSLLEMKTIDEAIHEVQVKFLPTYKVGVCVWPILQTINFSLIPERNRVPFVSICSLIWTSFLAYMKHLDAKTISSTKQPPLQL